MSFSTISPQSFTSTMDERPTIRSTEPDDSFPRRSPLFSNMTSLSLTHYAPSSRTRTLTNPQTCLPLPLLLYRPLLIIPLSPPLCTSEPNHHRRRDDAEHGKESECPSGAHSVVKELNHCRAEGGEDASDQVELGFVSQLCDSSFGSGLRDRS